MTVFIEIADAEDLKLPPVFVDRFAFRAGDVCRLTVGHAAAAEGTNVHYSAAIALTRDGAEQLARMILEVLERHPK